jgi:hypothetical protein
MSRNKINFLIQRTDYLKILKSVLASNIPTIVFTWVDLELILNYKLSELTGINLNQFKYFIKNKNNIIYKKN